MTTDEKQVAPFAIGDLVTSDYHTGEELLVRRLTGITEGSFGSGFGVQFDGGEVCQCCGRVKGTPVKKWIDSAWVQQANPATKGASE